MKERGYLNYLLIKILSKNITGLGGLCRVEGVLVGGWGGGKKDRRGWRGRGGEGMICEEPFFFSLFENQITPLK